jgi:hypothetical protein
MKVLRSSADQFHRLTDGTLVAAVSREGRSMLAQLCPEQRFELLKWMKEHPGHNGADWPGFSAPEARS